MAEKRRKLGTLNTRWSWEKPLPLEAKLEEFCLGLKEQNNDDAMAYVV